MNPSTPKQSWWPYGLIAYFIFFITCIVSFIAFAIRQDVHLVRADYYPAEVAHQQEIDRVSRGAGLGREVVIEYSAKHAQVGVRIPAAHAGDKFAGEVGFYRPNDPTLDHSIALSPDKEGRQFIDVSKLATGSWGVRLSWKCGEVDFAKTAKIVVVGPGV
jgi:hypothetical protein